METPRECLVMAKPAGPECNLRCSYCYYVGKKELLDGASRATEAGGASSGGAAATGASATPTGAAWAEAGARPMDLELLERYIAQRFAASSGPVTHFEWHGGESTLLGLKYFETIVRLQKKHRPFGRKVSNGLQTNGTLIDAAWADFLASEGFSVGLSLDGPAEMHDRYRRRVDGSPTQARVLEAFALLKERRVFTNILCVLSAANVGRPDLVYDFFKDIGATYLQFLPLVVRTGGAASDPSAMAAVSEATAPAEAIGAFLCRVFDRWIAEDVGRLVIQTFDEALRPVHGVEHALCVHRETCGDVAVLERDGSFYACDHFVDAAHRVGNLRERSLADLAADPLMRSFGESKKATLPRMCHECEFLAFCNGGCPKDRFLKTPDGEEFLNYLCPAYRAFFGHAAGELGRLSAHMKAGRRLREFKPAAAAPERPS
jgi:uncharacterized protein